MRQGKLILIPNLIGENNIDNGITKKIIDTIIETDFFIVENIKSARRFIKKVVPNKIIDNITFFAYGKHDNLDLQEDFLKNILLGNDIGLISEAGVPAVADPGAKIVEYAHQYKIRVVPLVGPSSILLALMSSGMNGQNFAFNGYLPIDEKEKIRKIKLLEKISNNSGQTQIFMETPYRNLQLFESVLKVCSKNTKLCIASNITLDSENIKTKTIEEWKSSNLPDIHKSPTIFLIYGR